jgi:regulator of sirC expression with transglutaminase-like and TPR domain
MQKEQTLYGYVLDEAVELLPPTICKREFVSVVALFDDPSPSVESAIASKIAQWGSDCAPSLRLLSLKSEDKLERLRATEFLQSFQLQYLKKVWDLFVEAKSVAQDVNLEDVVLLLSGFGYPETNPSDIRQYFDTMALKVHAHFMKLEVHSELNLLFCLNRVFFEEYQFRAPESTRYYDTDNTYLHTFIQYRIGKSITLATAYILVAERCGIEMYGVGLPAYFTVYHPALDLYIDPLNNGAFLSKDDCKELIEQSVDYDEKYLRRSSHIHILLRMMWNLIMCYVNMGNHAEQLSDTDIKPGAWERVQLEEYHQKIHALADEQ